MAITKILRKINPNRHGLLTLEEFTEEGESSTIWVVRDPDDHEWDADGLEFESLAEAEAHYDSVLHDFARLPNHRAQAEYDEVWGPPIDTYPEY